jgi:hypothetical protein
MTQLPWKLSQDRAGIRRRSEPGPVMSASLKAATSPVRPEQLVCPCTSQIPGNTFPRQQQSVFSLFFLSFFLFSFYEYFFSFKGVF